MSNTTNPIDHWSSNHQTQGKNFQKSGSNQSEVSDKEGGNKFGINPRKQPGGNIEEMANNNQFNELWGPKKNNLNNTLEHHQNNYTGTNNPIMQRYSQDPNSQNRGMYNTHEQSFQMGNEARQDNSKLNSAASSRGFVGNSMNNPSNTLSVNRVEKDHRFSHLRNEINTINDSELNYNSNQRPTSPPKNNANPLMNDTFNSLIQNSFNQNQFNNNYVRSSYRNEGQPTSSQGIQSIDKNFESRKKANSMNSTSNINLLNRGLTGNGKLGSNNMANNAMMRGDSRDHARNTDREKERIGSTKHGYNSNALKLKSQKVTSDMNFQGYFNNTQNLNLYSSKGAAMGQSDAKRSTTLSRNTVLNSEIMNQKKGNSTMKGSGLKTNVLGGLVSRGN